MRKKVLKRPLFAEIILTALSFLMMVILSYLFVSNIVNDHLVQNAESLLFFVQAQISSELVEPRINLNGFSRTVRSMILSGSDADTLQAYFRDQSKYLIHEKHSNTSFSGFFGYLETFPGNSVFIEGFNKKQPENYNPTDRPWYKNAVTAKGEIAETLLNSEMITGEPVIVYSLCIFDDNDRLLGVVGQRVSINVIGKKVIETALAQGGYGILLSEDLNILAHPNNDFIGRNIHDPEIPISIFVNELQSGNEVFEYPLVSYKNEVSVAFFRKLPNGWYLGLVTPKGQYYKSVRNMAFVLSSLGVAFAAALIFVLIRVDKAKKKSDIENRHKSAFLANMSHEIRTPMNAIIGMTAIGKSAAGPERKDYCFSKIEDASNHLLGVINDILDLSKIEANKFQLSQVEFDFEKMLQRVVTVVNFRVGERKQKLLVHIDKAIPKTIIGDDQRLAQVITNLLGNAVKFTPLNGLIKLDTVLLGEENGICTIKISVSDTGIGISQEHQKRLFDSFEQADTSTTRKFGGTGLGLSISKSIVELMGGKIWVESEPGKGATFSFTAQVKKDSEKKKEPPVHGVNWKNIRILAVDDDPDILDFFMDIAQGFNILCDTALNVEDALKLIEKNGSYHIYFLDWKLPGMDGFEIAVELKNHNNANSGFNSEVIMISAADWNSIAEEAKKAGVSKFLSKPLFPSAITDAINEILDIDHQEEREEIKTDIAGIFEGRCLLLAEDVEINREIVQNLLEPTLMEIDNAENGKEAVRMFREAPGKYDLILMDIQMPEMDGYEAAKSIRAIEAEKRQSLLSANSKFFDQTKPVPIIAMTANVFREDIEKCLKAGMNDHLGKPLNISEIFYKLQTYLPGNEMMEESKAAVQKSRTSGSKHFGKVSDQLT